MMWTVESETELAPNEAILSFAREEAADLPVELSVTPRPGDGYVVARENGRIAIVGNNARSCLYGVYHVKQGGAPGTFMPAFAVRGINPCESLACHTDAELRELIDSVGKWRMNTLVVHTAYGWRRHRDLIRRECLKRGIDVVFYIYTTLEFMPRRMPSSWLARGRDGRPLTRGLECESRICTAEPEALDAFAEGAREFMRTWSADATGLLATTGDGYGHCRCPRCRDVSPVEQWQPLLRRFVEAAEEVVPDKKRETLLYVQRYKLPERLDVHRRLDRLMFDTHLRVRWRPLNDLDQVHAPHFEHEVDIDARNRPINEYLLARLAEWRRKAGAGLYVFENLQMHGCMSCPQPNTGALLEDLRCYRDMSLSGVVYELLNGRHAYNQQVDTLAAGLWDPGVRHERSPVEDWCVRHAPHGPQFFLKRYDFPWEQYRDCFEEPVRQHMANLRDFFDRPTAASLRTAVEFVYAHPRHFARHSCAKRLFASFQGWSGVCGVTADETRFLQANKLWDFMEPLADPIAETDQIIQRLASRL